MVSEGSKLVCSSCGAPLKTVISAEKLTCEYCGTETLIPHEERQAADLRKELTAIAANLEATLGQPIEGIRVLSDAETAEFEQRKKSLIVAYLLLLFLGFFGVHRIYLGFYFSGIAYFFTMAGFGLGFLYDLGMLPQMVKQSNTRIIEEIVSRDGEPSSGQTSFMAGASNGNRVLIGGVAGFFFFCVSFLTLYNVVLLAGPWLSKSQTVLAYTMVLLFSVVGSTAVLVFCVSPDSLKRPIKWIFER